MNEKIAKLKSLIESGVRVEFRGRKIHSLDIGERPFFVCGVNYSRYYIDENTIGQVCNEVMKVTYPAPIKEKVFPDELPLP